MIIMTINCSYCHKCMEIIGPEKPRVGITFINFCDWCEICPGLSNYLNYTCRNSKIGIEKYRRNDWNANICSKCTHVLERILGRGEIANVIFK